MRDLSTALEYSCDSIWRQSYSLENKTCTDFKPGYPGLEFTAETFVLVLSLPGEPELDVQSLLPESVHVAQLTLDPKFAQRKDARTRLHVEGLRLVRDHMALHRGPRFALVLEASAVWASAQFLGSVTAELSATVRELPDSWTVVQLGLSSASSPFWAWSTLKSEWFKEGRPRFAVAPGSLNGEYFGGTTAFLVHERGVDGILSHVRVDGEQLSLSGMRQCSGCKSSGACSTYCLYAQEPMLLSTPPLFSAAAASLGSLGFQETAEASNPEQLGLWLSHSFQARQTRVLEPQLLQLLRQRASDMRSGGACRARSVGGIRLPASRAYGGWVVYSNPGADIGDQLQGVLSSWLLSLVLCRRFAGVLWDGSWAMDVFKVFGIPEYHHSDLEIAQPLGGGTPELHIEGVLLSSNQKKSKLSWSLPCGCPDTKNQFFKAFNKLEDLDRAWTIEVVTDCPFLQAVNEAHVRHPNPTPAYTDELNLVGVLSAMLLHPTPELQSLMPNWTVGLLAGNHSSLEPVVGLRPLHASNAPSQLLGQSLALDIALPSPQNTPPMDMLSCAQQLRSSPQTRFVVTGGSPDFTAEAKKRFGESRLLQSRQTFSSYEALPTGFAQFEMSIVWSLVEFLTLSVTHGMMADAADSLNRVAAMTSQYRFSPKSMDGLTCPHSGYVMWDFSRDRAQCFVRHSMLQLKPKDHSQDCKRSKPASAPARAPGVLSRASVPVTKHPLWATLTAVGMGAVFTVLIVGAAVGCYRAFQWVAFPRNPHVESDSKLVVTNL